MKSLSDNTAEVIDKPFVAPILLIEIEFTGLTLYLSSRPFDGRNTFDDHVYDPIIKSFSPIRAGNINAKNYMLSAGDFILDIMNDIPVGGYDSFSALINAYDWAFSTVTASQIHESAMAAADKIDIFRGDIENIVTMSREAVSLQISDIALSYKDKWPITIVNTDDYADADPDDVGKMLPQVWGSCYRVPFRAVDAGWLTTLAEDIADSDTGNVKLTDVSGLPASGTIQIDVEQMTYGSKSDTNNTVNISAREQGGTTATAHGTGANAAEIQTNYYYIIGHAVKAINDVYVDGVKQDTGNYTAYTGQTGDEDASYPGKAVIKFTTLPIIQKQVSVSLTDTIGVTHTDTNTDNLSASDSGHTHTGSETEIIVWENQINDDYSNCTFPFNWHDGDWDTATTFDTQNGYSEAIHGFNEAYPGDPYQIRLCARVGSVNGSQPWPDLQFHFCGQTLNIDEGDEDTIVRTSWATCGTSYDTWAEISAATMRIEKDDAWDSSLAIKRAWAEISTTPASATADISMSGSVTGTGSASKTGTVTAGSNSVADTVIGGIVAADVDGYQDDASGTITGSASALIERPDHILEHMVTEVLGEDIDETSYAASGAEYSSNSYTLGVCLLTTPKSVLDLFSRIARQARSLQFWEAGDHHLVYMSGSEPTDKTISGHRIDLNQLWLNYSLRTEVRNTFTGRYKKYWSGYENPVESDRAIVTSTGPASVTKYGALTENLELPFITDATQAAVIATWIRGEHDDPRLFVNFVGDISLSDIERGDVIEFDVTESSLNSALLGHVSSGDQFRVLETKVLHNFKRQIKCVGI